MCSCHIGFVFRSVISKNFELPLLSNFMDDCQKAEGTQLSDSLLVAQTELGKEVQFHSLSSTRKIRTQFQERCGVRLNPLLENHSITIILARVMSNFA